VSPEFAAMCTLVAMLMAGITITLVLRGPLGRALARRIEGKYANADDSAHVLELEQRIQELEHGQARMGELEERLDFAERLLSAAPDPRLRLPLAENREEVSNGR
jgi:hypothetical protein